MIRRTFSLLIPPLLLGACHKADDPVIAAAARAAHIDCALGGAGLKPDCTIEKAATDGGLALVIHHPDGGFRRLLVTADGRGVIAADGSQAATVSIVDPATIEVAVAGDRYRLPATVKGGPLPVR